MSRYAAYPIEVFELAQSLPTDVERHIVTLNTSECAADGQSTIPVPIECVARLTEYKAGLLTAEECARFILDTWRESFKD
jgi:hypothetical protein